MRRMAVVFVSMVSMAIIITLVGLSSWSLAAPPESTGAVVETTYQGQAVSRVMENPSIELELAKTVGLDPLQCATTSEITVAPGTSVTYCYNVTNKGSSALNRHNLVDSHMGIILDGYHYNLAPEASVFVTQTAVITETTTNWATWSGYNVGWTEFIEATDSATVTVVDVPSIAFTKTVGLDPAVCASADEITVGPNTPVTYCYEVTNTGVTTFGLHDLVDSELGVILDGFSFGLMPEASVFVTQTAVITETTVNMATWTAYNAGPTDVANDTDSATVTVVLPDLYTFYLPLILRR